MARSKEVRDEVLRLDSYHCQITGFDGRDLEERGQLEMHHVRPLGAGGSHERDTVENGITQLNSFYRECARY